MVNPVSPRDIRGLFVGSGDLRIARTIALRVSIDVLHDTVVPVGVQPTDLRTTLGLAWKTPSPPS